MENEILERLQERHGGSWGEFPDFPVADWRCHVVNDETRQGYWDWVWSELEADGRTDECLQCGEMVEETRSCADGAKLCGDCCRTLSRQPSLGRPE
jgi:hypothetical protein